MKKNLRQGIKLFLVIFLAVFIISAQAVAQNSNSSVLPRSGLNIESVSPNAGILGQDITLSITGTGFDENTKVFMIPDVGNKNRIIGSVDTPGNAFGIAISGNTAYVADGENGLQIIDITNIRNPKILNSINTSGSAYTVKVVGNMAYMGCSDNKFQIIDISNPFNPQLISTLVTPDAVYDIEIVNGIAYLGNYHGLRIVDIVNPAMPQIIGTIEMPNIVYAISIVDNIAYIANYGSGLQIIDISDSHNPNILTSYSKIEGIAYAIKVVGSIAFVAFGHGGLNIIDISDPLNPFLISSLNKETTYNFRDMKVIADRVYITDANDGLLIIDIKDIFNPKLIGNVDIAGHRIEVMENIAYVAAYSGGLMIVDVDNPSINNAFVTLDTNDAWGIKIIGDIAYVCNWSQGLTLVDISKSFMPKIIAKLNIYATDIEIADNTAYITAWDNGLIVLDISNPRYPYIVGTVDTPGFSEGITVSGNTAYVADGTGGLQIVDVTNRYNPVIIGSVSMPIYDPEMPGSTTGAIAVKGNIVYVGAANFGLQIIDVSIPSNPIIVQEMKDNIYSVDGLKIVDNFLYLADSGTITAGLTIMNIGYPKKPTIISSLATPYLARNITVNENKAYISDVTSIQIVDITNPYKPFIIGSLDTWGHASDIAVKNNIGYIADGETGMTVIPLPFESKSIIRNSSGNISATFSSPPIDGHYNIIVFNESERDEFYGAVTFIRPEQSSKLNAKAIIVAGGGPTMSPDIWEETKRCTNAAYKALKWQGYSDENIYYLISDTASTGRDKDASYENLSWAVNHWPLLNTPASELLIYFADHGEPGSFFINAQEKITVTELDQWLDTLQQTMTGQVIFIYDACYAGTFLKDEYGNPLMAPPNGKERIVITSTSDGSAVFADSGRNSFSYNFWNSVEDGDALDDAFYYARNRVKNYQTPLLDANANGISEESEDKINAGRRVGREYISSVARTFIGNVSAEPQILNGETTVAIRASGVASTEGNIERVWAVITPPDAGYDPSKPLTDADLITIELGDMDNDANYESVYNNFIKQGTYAIAVYAVNSYGYNSIPKYTFVTQMQGEAVSKPDAYELDDTQSEAKKIHINDNVLQHHNFHKPEDADWVKFYGFTGHFYEIIAKNPSAACDPVIELYNAAGESLLEKPQNDGSAGEHEILSNLQFSQDGWYYAKLTNANPNIFGETVSYQLGLKIPEGGYTQIISITVTDEFGQYIEDAQIYTDRTKLYTEEEQFLYTGNEGVYKIMKHRTGTDYTLTVSVPGYKTYCVYPVSFEVNETRNISVKIKPPGLSDAINVLKTVSGMSVNDFSCWKPDVSGNGRVGVEDAIFILQKVAELR